MASNGICDRVAIVGMGCTPFGEHWDKGADDLLIDAAMEACGSARVDKQEIDIACFAAISSFALFYLLDNRRNLHEVRACTSYDNNFQDRIRHFSKHLPALVCRSVWIRAS